MISDWRLGHVVGSDGADGKGIVSITKTGTSGLIDTYTITFTDGTSTTFTVTNGADGSADIVTSWESTLSDEKVPSEKLTKNSLDNKVDSVSGKGLSTNDFTTALKDKLDGIESQANKTTIVSSFSSTTSDSKVASEKLVKDTLDTKANSSSLSTVATSGSYSDLSNKPSIPSSSSDLSDGSDLIKKSNTSGLIKNDGTIDTTSYSTFSGSYNDLSNKPSILSHSDVYDDIILFADTLQSTLDPYTTYNAKFDGTETLEVSRGTVTASDGVLSASGTFYAHLTDYLINNDELWEISLEAKGNTNNCSFILSESGQTLNDKFELNFSANGNIYEFYNASTVHNANNRQTFNSNTWTPITIKKTDYNVLEITVNDVTNTYTWNQLGNLFDLEFGVYSWNTSTIDIRNLTIKTIEQTITYDTTVYNPSLDGTETLTTIASPLTINTTDNSLEGATGYLTLGYSNTKHWKITLKAKYVNDARYCSVSLFKKGITGASDIIQLLPSLPMVTYTNGAATTSTRTVTDTIGSSYTDVTIERVNPKYLKVTVGNNSVKGYWAGLGTYDTLCVGIYRWNNASAMTIKDILVKTP